MSAKVKIKTMEAIKRDRAKGDSPAEIAARYGVKPHFVRYHTKDIAPRKSKFLAPHEDKILLMVGLGYSQSAIARKFGVSAGAINKTLARLEWKAAA